jgi:hypothetical protein
MAHSPESVFHFENMAITLFASCTWTDAAGTPELQNETLAQNRQAITVE